MAARLAQMEAAGVVSNGGGLGSKEITFSLKVNESVAATHAPSSILCCALLLRSLVFCTHFVPRASSCVLKYSKTAFGNGVRGWARYVCMLYVRGVNDTLLCIVKDAGMCLCVKVSSAPA